jgi:hypothetical protein
MVFTALMLSFDLFGKFDPFTIFDPVAVILLTVLKQKASLSLVAIFFCD